MRHARVEIRHRGDGSDGRGENCAFVRPPRRLPAPGASATAQVASGAARLSAGYGVELVSPMLLVPASVATTVPDTAPAQTSEPLAHAEVDVPPDAATPARAGDDQAVGYGPVPTQEEVLAGVWDLADTHCTTSANEV